MSICMQLVITRSIHFQHKIPRISGTSCQCIWMQLSFRVCGNQISGKLELKSKLKIFFSDLKTKIQNQTEDLLSSQTMFPVINFFFRQEGWRLEHENPTDPQTPLIFKGVVFNEMKGAFVSFVDFFLFSSVKSAN